MGNIRNMFTVTNQSVVIGEHFVEYHPGTDPESGLPNGTSPSVSVFLEGVLAVVYRDFETGKVVVDVTGDPDRVLWNDATFNRDTNYVDENTTRIKYI